MAVPCSADPLCHDFQVLRNLTGCFHDPVGGAEGIQVRIRHKAAFADEQNPVCAFFKIRSDMRGKQNRFSVVFQVQEDFHQFIPADRIQAAGRFVQNDILGFAAQCLGDTDTLLVSF